jgi:lysozyme family protein
MEDLSREAAVAIYRRRYWLAPGLDRIARLDVPLAERLLDLGINMEPPSGIRFLQRALNVLNHQQAAFADIAVDGAFGPAPFAARCCGFTTVRAVARRWARLSWAGSGAVQRCADC